MFNFVDWIKNIDLYAIVDGIAISSNDDNYKFKPNNQVEIFLNLP